MSNAVLEQRNGSAATASATPVTPRSIALRAATVAVLVALDLWSKAAVFAWLLPVPAGMRPDSHGHLRWPVLGDWFGFMLTWNPGMAWGFDKLPTWLLVGGRVVAVLFLGWLVARAPAIKRVSLTALVLILSGALGNLYDNLFLEPRRAGATFGEVRDFIDVYFGVWDWHFPTFNVADACISVGAVLLFVSSFQRDPKPREASPDVAAR